MSPLVTASSNNTAMQLTLAIECQSDNTLTNFHWFNQPVLRSLIETSLASKTATAESFFYLWGQAGVGKSHLLQAITQAAIQPAIYLPLEHIAKHGPQIFEGLESYAWICLDNIHLMVGQPAMEEGLFHLYNRIKTTENGCLICSAEKTVALTPWQLQDLASRLQSSMSFELHELPDEEKAHILQRLARDRGFSLPNNVCDYLFKRFSRNMHYLQSLLDTLAHSSLVEQRKLSIPFVKQCLEGRETLNT